MDVNLTRLHLVLGKDDWTGSGEASGVQWNEADATLGLRTRQFVFPPRSLERPPRDDERRGAGRDRYGNWYWIDADQRRIRFLEAGQRGVEVFWPTPHEVPSCPSPADAGPFAPISEPSLPPPMMSGLAVTADHYLVVGVCEPAGLLIFDLRGGGPPLVMRWPAAVPFKPLDMATAADGIWILDAENKRYWGLDRYFRVRVRCGPGGSTGAPDFTPADAASDPGPLSVSPSNLTGDSAVPLDGVNVLIAIDALPDGGVLVLGRQPAALYRYRGDQLLARYVLDDALDGFDNVRASVSGAHDLAFVADAKAPPAGVAGTAYVVAADGNQTFAFRLDDSTGNFSFQPAFHPMRHYGGKALVAVGGGVFYDADDRWIALVQQPRPSFETEAMARFPSRPAKEKEPREQWAFDGKEPGCVWHRLFLDACIPPGSEVRLESRAADRKEDLAVLPWGGEPRPYLRADGAEIPFYAPPMKGGPERVGTWEVLFQNARGRYLQLRLHLRSTGRTTPRLQAMRIYYPRFSYLGEYLPALYRDDEASASFLDRYLANVEGLFTVLEGRIEQAQTLFDVRTVPTAYLDWLAGWLGATLDFSWDERTKRLFLAHAPQIMRERGTRAGLVRALRLAFERCTGDWSADDLGFGTRHTPPFSVRVVERYLTRRAPGVVFGDPTDVSGPGSTTDILAWTPAMGAEPLHRRYRDFLREMYVGISALNDAWGTGYRDFDDPQLRLAAVWPSRAAESADWQRFVRERLGFTYAIVTATDEPLYQDFLARRYRQPSDLRRAYGLGGPSVAASFEAVRLPGSLPDGGPALQDWITFVSLVLPTQRNAHRFTVLVPVTLDDDPDSQLRKLELARRITELEKPAHTTFDVRLYWAMFRVGEARVGLESVVGQGSRFSALVLGRGVLGQSYLGYAEPWSARDRGVVGRDRLGQRTQTMLPT